MGSVSAARATGATELRSAIESAVFSNFVLRAMFVLASVPYLDAAVLAGIVSFSASMYKSQISRRSASRTTGPS